MAERGSSRGSGNCARQVPANHIPIRNIIPLCSLPDPEEGRLAADQPARHDALHRDARVAGGGRPRVHEDPAAA